MFMLVESAEGKRHKRKSLEKLKEQKLKFERIVYGIGFFSTIGFAINFSQGFLYDTTTVERSLFFILSLIFLGMMIAWVPVCIILDKIESKIELLKRSEEGRETTSAEIAKRRFDSKFYILLIYILGGLFFMIILIWGDFNVIFAAVFAIGFWTSLLISIWVIYVFPYMKKK